MQRIAGALAFCAFVTIVGCSGENPATQYDRPLPEPLLTTKKYSTPPPGPPSQSGIIPSPGGIPNEWTPAGGIKRGMWKQIVVHHAASERATPQTMNTWHLKRGWENGLGYHFVIGNGVNYPDGKVYVGPRWKRQQVGAHCKSGAGRFFGIFRDSGYFNEHGIGICLIGDFEKSRPTAKQMESLAKLTAFLCDEAGVSPDAIHGHGEITGKTQCPGKNFSMAAIRRAVKQLSASSN